MGMASSDVPHWTQYATTAMLVSHIIYMESKERQYIAEIERINGGWADAKEIIKEQNVALTNCKKAIRTQDEIIRKQSPIDHLANLVKEKEELEKRLHAERCDYLAKK